MSNEQDDPRIYLAAERTFLAWLRTGIALMGFGFILSRFGVFLHEMALARGVEIAPTSRLPSYLGLALIVLGVLLNGYAAVKQHRYVRALDAGRFRSVFGTGFGFVLAAVLLLLGAGMVVYLLQA